MTASADTRPAGIDAWVRPGNPVAVDLVFPAGELVGRTFTATLNGTALDVTADGDTLTVAASAATTAALTGPAAWVLTEELPTPVDLLVGTWVPSDRPAAATASPVEVAAGSIVVEATLSPVSTAATLAGRLTSTYRTTSATGLSLTPFAITAVPLTTVTIQDWPFPVELRGRGTLTHSVADALVGLAVGAVGATINQELDLAMGMAGAPGAGPTLHPLGELPAHSPGDYQLFAWSFSVGTGSVAATPSRKAGIGVYRAQ